MNDIYYIIQVLIILFNLSAIIYIFLKLESKYNTCNRSIRMLSTKHNLLKLLYRKQTLHNMKKMIDLHRELQSILKISKSSYISLFKYNYTKRYITLNFLFSINNNDEIIYENYLNELPATSNTLNLKILKSDGLDNIDSVGLNKISQYSDIKKMYFKNIKKNSVSVGYVAFSYLSDYQVDFEQRREIEKITNKISELL